MQTCNTLIQRFLSGLLAQAAWLSVTATGSQRMLHSQCAPVQGKNMVNSYRLALGTKPMACRWPRHHSDNCQSAAIVTASCPITLISPCIQHPLISRKVTKQRPLLLPPEHWLASFQLPPQPSLRASRSLVMFDALLPHERWALGVLSHC